MIYKIYTKENYFIIENTIKNEFFYGTRKNVEIDPSNTGKEEYRFFNVKDWDSNISIRLSSILKEDSSPYTQSEWETFYTENTGNFGSAVEITNDVGNPIPVYDSLIASGKTAITGTFTASNQVSLPFTPISGRSFNITRNGTGTANIRLERSFNGTNWHPITANGTTIMNFTTSFSEQWSDDELNVQYRLNCTSYISGMVTYRISQ